MEIWAPVFLVITFPFCIWATWSDLKYLKIPNRLSLFMVGLFIVVGPFVLPFDEYTKSLLFTVIALLASIVIHALRLVAAGDLKFTTAIIPFIQTSDLLSFVMLVALCSLSAVIIHSIVGRIGLAPKGWASWEGVTGLKKRFPLGFALAGALFVYLLVFSLLTV